MNDAPHVDLASYVVTYTENGAAVPIADASDRVTDPDGTIIQSAVITLTDPITGDLLASGTMPTGIVASVYDPTANTITLTGAATLADYQQAKIGRAHV